VRRPLVGFQALGLALSNVPPIRENLVRPARAVDSIFGYPTRRRSIPEAMPRQRKTIIRCRRLHLDWVLIVSDSARCIDQK
jgi:hypothetical protein